MAVGFADGKVTLIRMSTGEILDKYASHNTEPSALFFDGLHLFSGGRDGILNIYNITFDSPRKLGTCIKQFKQHEGMITGIRYLQSFGASSSSFSGKKGKASTSSAPLSTLITCGADRKLIAIDKDTYECYKSLSLIDLKLSVIVDKICIYNIVESSSSRLC